MKYLQLTAMYRRSQMALLLAAAAYLLAGCASAPPAAPANETVRVYAGPFLAFSPLHLAKERGYFAQQGIEIELTPLKSSLDAVPALAQGDIDVVLSSPNLAQFNTIARGGRIRLVGGLSFWDHMSCPTNGLVARKQLDVHDVLSNPAKRRTLKLATGALGVEGYYVDTYLGRYGLSLDDLHVQDVPPAAIGEALAQKGLDLANVSVPWITRILKDGQGEVVVGAKDVLPDMPSGVVAFGDRLLAKDTDLGERFMKGLMAGLHDYQQGKTDANVAAIAGFTGLEPELVKQACWPAMSPDGSLAAEHLVGFEEWAFAKGTVDKVLAPDEFYDSRFVEAATSAAQTGTRN